VARVRVHVFPDGETALRVDTNPRGFDVIILAGLREPNVTTVPVLLLAEAMQDAGAARVGLVAPYLPYMRQDIAFHPGEAVTARLYARMLSHAFDWLLTVDPHLHRIHRLADVYSIPATSAHAAPLLGRWIASNVDRPLVIGPDEESRQWASAVAAAAGAPCIVSRKIRTGDETVVVETPSTTEFREHTPVFVDDMISTGRTMAAAVRQVAATSRRAPVCVAVHAVFAGDAEAILRHAGAARVVTTNTIPHSTNAIDVAPLLAAELQTIVPREAACLP
jgi:ribose-phosphate pyrophosphokinase